MKCKAGKSYRIRPECDSMIVKMNVSIMVNNRRRFCVLCQVVAMILIIRGFISYGKKNFIGSNDKGTSNR